MDDWAWRRGYRYGTIPVAFERNEVVDLLLDRQAEMLAEWPCQNSGIEIVARDRACASADGVRQGAPEAVQVLIAGTFCAILAMPSKAVIDRHHGDLRRAAKHMEEQITPPSAAEGSSEPATPKVTATQHRRQDAHARRHALYRAVQRSCAATIESDL